jgi:hypothetical protein
MTTIISCGYITSYIFKHFSTFWMVDGKIIEVATTSVCGLCNYAWICGFSIGWTHWILWTKFHNSFIIRCQTLDGMNGQLLNACTFMWHILHANPLLHDCTTCTLLVCCSLDPCYTLLATCRSLTWFGTKFGIIFAPIGPSWFGPNRNR